MCLDCKQIGTYGERFATSHRRSDIQIKWHSRGKAADPILQATGRSRACLSSADDLGAFSLGHLRIVEDRGQRHITELAIRYDAQTLDKSNTDKLCFNDGDTCTPRS